MSSSRLLSACVPIDWARGRQRSAAAASGLAVPGVFTNLFSGVGSRNLAAWLFPERTPHILLPSNQRLLNRSRSLVSDVDLSKLSVSELLGLSRRVLAELREQKVLRTGNAPTGDYAEWLVQRATGGTLEPNSKSSWDLKTSEGERLQVKARVVVNPRNKGQRQLSPFRSWEFDAAVVVLFNDEFKVWKSACLSVETLKEGARYSKHVNGELVFATDDLLSKGQDWTERLVEAANRPSL